MTNRKENGMMTTRKWHRGYVLRVCEVLNVLAKNGPDRVRGQVCTPAQPCVGIVVLEKVERGREGEAMPELKPDGQILEDIRNAIPSDSGKTLEQILETIRDQNEKHRSIVLYSGKIIYVMKPVGHQSWTRTVAMYDARDIARIIFMAKATP